MSEKLGNGNLLSLRLAVNTFVKEIKGNIVITEIFIFNFTKGDHRDMKYTVDVNIKDYFDSRISEIEAMCLAIEDITYGRYITSNALSYFVSRFEIKYREKVFNSIKKGCIGVVQSSFKPSG